MPLRSNSSINSSNSVTTSSAITEDAHQNRIKKLPPLLVNQLAAGEVVTRPASVVKELIENAIDAGATCIDVHINQGGMALIKVSDNGCGIHQDDMVMAVTRHATSKIADMAQLQGVATLGFRGEALAATAAVSRLTLTSSCDDSGIGRELNIAGILTDTPVLTPVVRTKGTTITVKDLYFNVPARRSNLKSIATEFAHIESVVKQLALVASNISITLWHNDKQRFGFDAVSNQTSTIFDDQQRWLDTIFNRLTCIFPQLIDQFSTSRPNLYTVDKTETETQILPLTLSLNGLLSNETETLSGSQANNQISNQINSQAINDTHSSSHNAPQLKQSDIGVYGFLVPYDANNTSATQQPPKLIYINGRLVKDRRLAQCVRESATCLSGGGKGFDSYDLGYVLFFELPMRWLNVNVHPEKQCIKVQNMANISAHLTVAIRDVLQAWMSSFSKDLKQSQLPNVQEDVSAFVANQTKHNSQAERSLISAYKSKSKSEVSNQLNNRLDNQLIDSIVEADYSQNANTLSRSANSQDPYLQPKKDSLNPTHTSYMPIDEQPHISEAVRSYESLGEDYEDVNAPVMHCLKLFSESSYESDINSTNGQVLKNSLVKPKFSRALVQIDDELILINTRQLQTVLRLKKASDVEQSITIESSLNSEQLPYRQQLNIINQALKRFSRLPNSLKLLKEIAIKQIELSQLIAQMVEK